MKKLSVEAKLRQKRIMKRRLRNKIKRSNRPKRSVSHFERIAWSLSPVINECLRRLRGNVSLLTQFSRNYFLRTGTLKIPETLSLFENPEETLQILSELTFMGTADGVARVFFDHSDCKNLELGASAIMDVITMELQRGWNRRKVRYELGGKSPNDEEVKEIFFASGLPNSLKVETRVRKELSKKYFIFDLMDGGKENPQARKSAQYEIAAQKLTDYFDKCLERNGVKLTRAGRHNISLMIGEVLTNAEEHSNHGRWYVIGYLRKRGDYDEVNIVIFNFGNTIYESFMLPQVDPIFKGQLESLSVIHGAKGFFQKGWDQETLWTLYSLQEGVSKYSGTPRGIDRGSGTVRMIEFFQNFGKPDSKDFGPQMCLISGSTFIFFDGTYKMRPRQKDTEVRSVIAFNSDNDLFRPPDKKYVRKMDANFPGTIVSMKFYLDKQYLQDMLNKDKQGATNAENNKSSRL